MFLRKNIKSIFLITFIVLNVFRGYSHSATVIESPRENDILKSELLLDAKGVIEPATEICNGGSFHHSIHKLKNSFGTYSSFSVKQNGAKYFFSNSFTRKSQIGRIPIFLFTRSIII